MPFCKPKDENLNDKSIDELMNIMEPDKLNLIKVNKLILVRRFAIFVTVSNLFYQFQNFDKLRPLF